YRLAKLGMEDWVQWALAVVCFGVTVALQAEVALLFIGAGIVGILYYGRFWRRTPSATTLLAAAPLVPAVPLTPVASASTLTQLFLFFLNAGALTFASPLVPAPSLHQGSAPQYGALPALRLAVLFSSRTTAHGA